MADVILSTAHLKRELGDESFKALVDPKNVRAVCLFAVKLHNAVHPVKLNEGDIVRRDHSGDRPADDLSAVTLLKDRLGLELFDLLISSDNTGEVRAFARQLHAGTDSNR